MIKYMLIAIVIYVLSVIIVRHTHGYCVNGEHAYKDGIQGFDLVFAFLPVLNSGIAIVEIVFYLSTSKTMGKLATKFFKLKGEQK